MIYIDETQLRPETICAIGQCMEIENEYGDNVELYAQKVVDKLTEWTQTVKEVFEIMYKNDILEELEENQLIRIK